MKRGQSEDQPLQPKDNARGQNAQTILGALTCERPRCKCHAAVRRGNGGTHCPCHEDRTPSLSVTNGRGRVLVHCQAGCEQDDVIAALTERDLWPRRNDAAQQTNGARRNGREVRDELRDEKGAPVAVHVRRVDPKGKKIGPVLWMLPDGTPGLAGLRVETLPLFGAEHLRKIKDGMPIIAVEGETPCKALRDLGLASVATVCGAAVTPTDDVLRPLARLAPILWLDNDDSGRAHMERIAARLYAHGARPRIIQWPSAPPKGDAADFVALGGTIEDVRALADAAKLWQPPASEDTGALLNDVAAFFRRYIVISDEQADAVALWILHTHAIDAAEVSPYLNVTSVEKRSGKTRLLSTLALLAARPWLTSRLTTAVLVRKIDAEAPTLLLDESDAAFRADKEYAETLRGILNSGYERTGTSSLCIGQGSNISYRDFSTFCPKAIAGIGRLPDTVEDRSIRIELKRKRRDEPAEKFRRRSARAGATPLHQRLERWAAAHVDALRDAEPDLPGELDDRAADVWEPLFAIAELAGGHSPARARKAALALSAGDTREDDSRGVRLLADIRIVLDERRADRMPSAELVHALIAIEEAPWGDLRGRPLDAAKLARLLKPYEIRPKKLREGETTWRGYQRADFEDPWMRYLSAQAGTGGTGGTSDVGGSSVIPLSVPRVPAVPSPLNCEDQQERCVCGAALCAYTPNGRAVCARHTAPETPCRACGCAVLWARQDGGWDCSRCHPAPSADAVLEKLTVELAR